MWKLFYIQIHGPAHPPTMQGFILLIASCAIIFILLWWSFGKNITIYRNSIDIIRNWLLWFKFAPSVISVSSSFTHVPPSEIILNEMWYLKNCTGTQGAYLRIFVQSKSFICVQTCCKGMPQISEKLEFWTSFSLWNR